MSDQVRIFSQDGLWIDQLRTTVERGWLLMAETSAKFSVSIADDKCNPFVLNYGNILLVENSDGLPPWVGMIDKRYFENGALVVIAYSPERWLFYRRGPQTLKLTGSAGQVFAQLIRYAEGVENTVLEVGIIDSDFKGAVEILTPGVTLNVNLSNIVKASREGYQWRPEVVNGKLTIYGDWYESMTFDTGLVLVDGHNISGSRSLSESPPINDFLTYGTGSDWTKRLTANAIDAESREQYGIRQAAVSVGTNSLEVLGGVANANLSARKQPAKSFPLSVLNANNTYSKVAPGVKAVLTRLVGRGFSGNELGYETTEIYIKGMNYNPPNGNITLVL